MRRTILKGIAALLLLITLVAAGGYLYLRRSLPQLSGTVEVTGLTATVDIVRDAHGVPHILASTRLDALFGLGFAHAQDRLWQMEFQRRIAHGRLSEIFGAATISRDRFLRTVGFGRAALAAWTRLPQEEKSQIDAYVAGVNAFIATHKGSRLPPEFTLLRFEPEPFTPVDVVGWGKMMAWDLSANYSIELLRHDIAAQVGEERLRALMPPYPPDALSIVRDHLAPLAGPPTDRTSRVLPVSGTAWSSAFMTGLGSGPDSLWAHAAEGLGSNNWAVDGTMSAGGKPMLASDPHLAPKLPSLWYLAHLKAGDFEVMGATLPGAPAVVIGRNRHIAWGVTNVAADVQDLFQERLDATGTHAEFKGANEPLRLSTETILVKGGEPITLRVRASRHGPLVSDAINENNAEALGKAAPRLEPLAFRWTALDDDDPSIAAFLQLNEARNWTEFTRALSSFVVPSQNFVYADVDGHIGYYAPGRIPIRAAGDGSMPVPGWTGEFEWTGWIPFDRLPHSFDPPEHFIVTANHRPMPAGYPYHISLEYPEPYRAQRITDLLTAQPKHSVESFRRIQADTLSLHARALVPVLLARVGAVEGRSRDALDQVKRWNGDLGGESAAAAIFQVWFLDLAQAVVEDELGPKVTQTYVGRYSSVTRFLLETLRSADNAWCDRVTTTVKESCDQIVADSFQRAVAFLTERLGSDATRWRWDDLHRAVFPHQGLDTVPVLGWLLRRSIPNGGDFATVNVAPIDPGRLYDQREVTSYRQIFDLTSLDDNHFLDPTGQSGHILSRYYDESLADWQAVQPRRIHMSREEVERTAIGRLQLKPH